jgi:hypothetical protein
MKRRLWFFFCIISLLSLDCKKSNSSNSCTLSATTILGTYNIVGLRSQDTPTSAVVDDYAASPSCQKDDIITLYADGTYKRVDVGTTCSTPAEVITGTWSLSGNTFVSDGSPGTATFDCHTLVVTSTDYPKETDTLVKQ